MYVTAGHNASIIDDSDIQIKSKLLFMLFFVINLSLLCKCPLWIKLRFLIHLLIIYRQFHLTLEYVWFSQLNRDCYDSFEFIHIPREIKPY